MAAFEIAENEDGRCRPSRYHRLSSNEIRVLRAVQGSSGSEWRCEVLELDNGHEFYAISYTWGDDYRYHQHSILVNGEDCSIGNNAYEVLQFMCSNNSVDRSIPVWLDAVCIDQADESDKLQQIPLMRRVYSQASMVWVFLGKALQRRLVPRERKPSDSSKPDIDMAGILEAMDQMETGDKLSHVQYGRPLHNNIIKHQDLMCDLLTKPWWSRLWTMQEYVLARDSKFVYGNTVIKDEDLRKYVDRYNELNLAEIESLMSPYHFKTREMMQEPCPEEAGAYETRMLRLHDQDARKALPELQLFRQQISRFTNAELSISISDMSVLASSFNRNATVPLDKILGLLGLLQGSKFDNITSSLGMAHPQIFESVAKSALMHGSAEHCLALLNYVDTVDELSNAPSWVPNFSSRLKAHCLSPFDVSRDFLYNAGMDNALIEETETGRLRVRGKLLDSVAGSVDFDTFAWNYVLPPGEHYSCASQLKFERSCLQLCTKSAPLARKQISKDKAAKQRLLEGLGDAYCATLVAGSCHQGVDLVRWRPSLRVYRQWMKRMTTLADPNFDWLHNSRNPGTQYDKGFLYGEHKNHNKAMETGGEPEQFHQRFYEVCRGRTFFTTDTGLLGLGTSRTREGDLVAIFCGGRTPFIVRSSRSTDSERPVYRLIGEAYVHGVMDGEAFSGDAFDDVQTSWIELT